MSYEDLLAAQLSDARQALIDCPADAEEIEKRYSHYKGLTHQASVRSFHVQTKFISPEEWTYFSMLDELVTDLPSDLLDAIVKSDNGFRTYIEEWTEMDGFVAKLKYQIKPPNLDIF